MAGSTHATIANTGYLKIGTTSLVQWNGSALSPVADSTYTLGTSSAYWSNGYIDRLYLNSTAYIDGGTAGALGITGLVGIGTTAPTHTLTLPSTSTGIALYNTANQTIDYERVRMVWASNVFNIYGEIAGTGSPRAIRISAFGNTTQALQLNSASTNGFIQAIGTSGTASAIIFNASGALSSSSGIQYGAVIQPTFTQSSTAGYTALLINPTESTVGSGAKLLADFQVGSVSRAKLDNTGELAANVLATKNVTTVSTAVDAGYSSYVPDFLEIGGGFTYEIGLDSRLEIG
jgi:hypothetical protein